jgi:hypothetical protein
MNAQDLGAARIMKKENAKKVAAISLKKPQCHWCTKLKKPFCCSKCSSLTTEKITTDTNRYVCSLLKWEIAKTLINDAPGVCGRSEVSP